MDKEKTKEKESKYGKAGVVLGIIAIIIAIMCLVMLVYWDSTGHLKGDPGLSIKGEQGVRGPSPNFEWNLTSIHFQKPDGTWSSWVNLKGVKGDKGDSVVGPRGATGGSGKDGKDAPINHPPIITLLNLSGTHNKCGESYFISLNITDPDHDAMNIKIKYRFSLEHTWTLLSEIDGYDGIYNATKIVDCHIYWLIEVWDGSKISFQNYEYTIGV